MYMIQSGREKNNRLKTSDNPWPSPGGIGLILFCCVLSTTGFFGQIAFGDVHHRCGISSPYTDGTGRVWYGDRPFTSNGWGYTNAGVGTAVTTDPISGTDDDPLYRSERYGSQIGYRYEALPDGIYDVTFKLCELYWTADGQRIFDVAVNGLLVLDDLDIHALVGHDAALDVTVQVKVDDETLIITVPQVKKDYAKFASIGIDPGTPDEVAPAAPSDVHGQYLSGSVELGWTRNTEPDIQGYHVYRSHNGGGSYEKINSEPVKGVETTLIFSDSEVNPAETYFYAITAVDASDNESDPSSPVRIVTTEHERDYWDIPECAWSRPFGDHPGGATGRTKRGVPLGGIGAGNVMYNLCGTFGPWEFQIGTHEEKFLSQGAFHLYEQVGDGDPSVRTLATEDVMSAWNRLPAGVGTYYALYPKAWFTYTTFVTDVSLKQFTPIIPHNYKETSYPIGIFQFKVSNPTQDSIDIAIMFTFPNADYADETRKGYNTQVEEDGDISGIVLKATHPGNSSVAQNSEWCIAVSSTADAFISYVTSWDTESDGSDIYSDFSDDGVLSNGDIDQSASAAAVAVKLILPPEAVAEVPFVITWDFPRVRFGEGTEWYRRYTEYFGTSSNNSFDIAREALLNYEDWEEQVDEWHHLILDEPAYPQWLKQGALNELYYDTFGGIFWENGCFTKPAESSYGTLPADDHKYFSMECQAYPMCETFDVRHYECRHYLEMWPEIERDVLRWFADYIANDPQGKAPHDAGRPDQDPFFRFSGYGSDWQDMPSKFIQQVYAYCAKTGDEAFLDAVWPACKKTFSFMKTKDANGNYLPDHGNTTYDTWMFVSDNLLCGCLWVGALEAMEQMAMLKDDDILYNVRQWLSIARLTLDVLFWEDDLGYYVLDHESDAIMADGLNGQRYAETTGLEDILPAQRIASHLNQVYERCVRPWADYTGDGEGDVGAVNGREADGSAVGKGQPDEVWTGSTYFVAAMMYRRGEILGDPVLQERALKTAYGVYYQTWVNEQTAYFFNTPEAWRYDNPGWYRAPQYQRPRAIWELLLEIKNPFEEQCSGQIGDVNGDNRIDVFDVVNLVNYILGTVPLDDCSRYRADVHVDGLHNVLDLVSIINIILGTEPR